MEKIMQVTSDQMKIIDLKNMYMTVTSTAPFNIQFNFDVGSPSLSTDWLGTKPELPFQGTTGENIPAGTLVKIVKMEGVKLYAEPANIPAEV